MDLGGKTFLITGGTGGLGGAVTEELLGAGAAVAVTYRNPTEWEELQSRLGARPERLEGFRLDVTDPGAASSAVEAIETRFGRLDGLVHLVGGFVFGKVESTGPEALDRMLSMNLRSAYVMAHAVIPALRRAGGGKILAVGARPALKGTAGLGAYAASKAGVVNLIETLAEELKDAGIQANCVLPSIIDTPANRAAMPDADPARWVTPAQIARVLHFLASSDADVISGAAIPVYGRS